MRFTQKEIREQLADLGAFRQEVLEEHLQGIESVSRKLADAEGAFLTATRDARADLDGLGAEHVEQMKRLERATAEWSARAVAAGMSEVEVLELLGVGRSEKRLDRSRA